MVKKKKKSNPNLIQNQKWYLKYAICEHCYFSKKPVKKLCNKCLKKQNNIQKLIKNNEDNLQSIKNNEDNLQSIKNNEDNLQSIKNNLILSYPYTSICIGITIVYSIITIFKFNYN
jgi:septal ring factor EnvC (AmiA/AmiB activator)